MKPEFLQCVLEIATGVHSTVRAAGRRASRAARSGYRGRRRAATSLIGAAGTHPFARWEDQRIVERERYEELAENLGFILRQFVIFGTHIHVGIKGADRAVYVADGIRRHLPLLLALSCNSPFHAVDPTGMALLANAGLQGAAPLRDPAAFRQLGDLHRAHRADDAQAGSIEDYTYLWWDVRPHPRLGTVETRIFDQQTRGGAH